MARTLRSKAPSPWFDDLGTLWNGDGTPIVQFQPHAQVEWRDLEKG